MTRIFDRLSSVLVCSGLLWVAACAPVRGPLQGPPAPAFSDALNPPGGTPCDIPAAVYPAAALAAGESGRVHITYVIGVDGHVEVAIIDTSSGYRDLDEAARNTVLQARCKPYSLDGVPRRVIQTVSIRFPDLNIEHREPRSAAAPLASGGVAAGEPPSSPETRAMEDADLQKLGIVPGSSKAAIAARWRKRMQDDADIRRFVDTGQQINFGLLDPQTHAAVANDGTLRLSPIERTRLLELTTKALEMAPSDCGGTKDANVVMRRYLSLGALSDEQVDRYFGLIFALYKASATHAPKASVTDAQFKQGQDAVAKVLLAQHNDPEDARQLAALAVDPAGVDPSAWCKGIRLYQQAMLATAEPYRDWAFIGMLKHAPPVPTEPPAAPQMPVSAPKARGLV